MLMFTVLDFQGRNNFKLFSDFRIRWEYFQHLKRRRKSAFPLQDQEMNEES